MKPYATYGKKPRGSKTSKRTTICGIPVFLHYTASTGKILNVYHDVKPYPRIITTAGDSYWNCVDKVESFFNANALAIQDTLNTLDINFGINKDLLDKAIQKKSDYKIYEKNPFKASYKLVVHKHENDYVYLFVNKSEAPTKNIKGKKVSDSEKIYEEFLRRKSEDSIILY